MQINGKKQATDTAQKYEQIAQIWCNEYIKSNYILFN